MKVTGRKRAYDGFLKVDLLTIALGNGQEIEREVIVRKSAVAALVFDTKEKKYILVSQFRPGPEAEITEIVAGTMDVEGESPESCITREIEEEIGYKVDKLEFITWCYFSPGGLTEKIHIFYAEVSEKISEGGGIGDEEIKTVYVSSDDELSKLEIHDSKTCIAIQWLLKKKFEEEMAPWQKML